MDTVSLICKLIEFQSVSGKEQQVVSFVAELLEELGLRVELLPVGEGRNNVFAYRGEPKIVFSTHLDVVPAQEAQFIPRIEDKKIFGRGACDAKGIAAAMIEAAMQLVAQNASDFALLFVISEETDGLGARSAAKTLKGTGIEYLINGEPTENKLITHHRGGFAFSAEFEGMPCHSGYPELGVDANRKLVNAAAKLMRADFGYHPQLGQATINVGQIQGGSAVNIVSPKASLTAGIRTVSDNAAVAAKVREICAEASSISVMYDSPCTELYVVDGFETSTASFCTDVPNFAELDARCLLYGPGSIHRAHTDHEFITIDEIDLAVKDYVRLYSVLMRDK